MLKNLRLFFLALALCACEKSVAPDETPNETWIARGTGDGIIDVPSDVSLVDISAISYTHFTIHVEVKCLLESGVWWPEAVLILNHSVATERVSIEASSRENISDCTKISIKIEPERYGEYSDEIYWTVKEVP